jgi:hypothetical protein
MAGHVEQITVLVERELAEVAEKKTLLHAISTKRIILQPFALFFLVSTTLMFFFLIERFAIKKVFVCDL